MNPKTFQCDYPGIDSVFENIVQPAFGETDRLNEDVIRNNGLKAHANEAKIEKITRIAEYSLDGNPFNIFDVELSAKVELFRNRIAIKKLLVSQVDVFSSSLIFFHYADPQGKEWRISYFAKGRGNMDTTSPRRYTFLCGKTHGCRTIAERFEHLKNQPEKTRALLTEVFSVEALNKEFYQKLANWFFWALSVVRFPEGKDDSKKNAVPLIRLITRLMFVWFMRKKGLVPDKLFQKRFVDSILKPGCDESAYYKAILQNLFFATLNTEQTDREARKFRTQERHNGRNEQFQIYSVYRYEDFFSDKGKKVFLDLMQDIPFLNGGLFTCLDSKNAVDAFSDRTDWRDMLYVPDALFWTTEEENFRVDLNSEYGDKQHGRESVLGLITLLDQYNFTIDENSRDEAMIALDPELLGMIFENLLASYNPETATTARKQTGSFYTPREIVDYMVEESLIRHLLSKNISGISEAQIRKLVNEDTHPDFTAAQKNALVKAIESCKILDPACGSGAFPMGLLHNLVRILEKIQPVCSFEDLYKRKLHIIQNCIYGIDIQPIAVQIAKLRCFISLLADNTLDNHADNRGIEPLPNLEMHFVAANSLLDIELSAFDEWTNDPVIQALTTEIKKLRSSFFSIKRHVEKKTMTQQDEELRSKLSKELIRLASSGNQEKIAMLKNRISQLQAKRNQYLETNLQELAPHQEDDSFFDFAKPDRSGSLMIDVNEQKRKEIDNEINRCQRDLKKELKVDGKTVFEEATKLANWNPFDPMTSASFFNPQWMFGSEDGFDIVIGNPPYRQLQDNSGELADLYSEPVNGNEKIRKSKFVTFARTGDIYCLFYERGVQLLKDKGHLCYITSNTWMRAGFGETTRKFFAEKTNPKLLIDFAGEKIFESATVNTNILLLEKTNNEGKTRSCVVQNVCRDNLSLFVQQNSMDCQFTTSDSWTILSPIEQSIKRKIEAIGTPLKDWDISINYGIKTGCNEAFIINAEKRQEILDNCRDDEERRRTDELIRPILRGRDIRRYGYDWANLYLIATFPARRYDIEQYPAVKKHFLTFDRERLEEAGRFDLLLEDKLHQFCRGRLEQAGGDIMVDGVKIVIDGKVQKSRKQTGNKWFETQDQIGYWDDFSKQKILWGEISDRTKFMIDENGSFYNEATTFLLTGNNLIFLVCYLNSSLSEYLFSKIGTKTGVGTIRWKKFKIEQLMIPVVDNKTELFLSQCLNAYENGNITLTELEFMINDIFFKKFSFSDEEIEYIRKYTPGGSKSDQC